MSEWIYPAILLLIIVMFFSFFMGGARSFFKRGEPRELILRIVKEVEADRSKLRKESSSWIIDCKPLIIIESCLLLSSTICIGYGETEITMNRKERRMIKDLVAGHEDYIMSGAVDLTSLGRQQQRWGLGDPPSQEDDDDKGYTHMRPLKESSSAPGALDIAAGVALGVVTGDFIGDVLDLGGDE